MPLTLLLNGNDRTFPGLAGTATLDQLVGELGLKADRVAIEHNGEIVSRSRWSQTVLGEGDRLELVHFVGGGSGDQAVARKALPRKPSKSERVTR